MLPEKTKGTDEGVFRNNGIRVQKQNVSAAGFRKAPVRGGGETQIRSGADKSNIGKTRAEIIKASISRKIIEYDHLSFHAGQRALNGMKALLQEIPDIVTYDDDGKIQWAYLCELIGFP
jgi:hypothetical protein